MGRGAVKRHEGAAIAGLGAAALTLVWLQRLPELEPRTEWPESIRLMDSVVHAVIGAFQGAVERHRDRRAER